MSEEQVSKLPEAPMSGNLRGYYKGYSIQITARDPEVKVKPLLDKLVEIADYMEENGFKPSWNEQTNKGYESNGSARVNEPSEEAATMACKTCGEPATKRSGVSKKTGKPYTALFCSSQDGTHTAWL